MFIERNQRDIHPVSNNNERLKNRIPKTNLIACKMPQIHRLKKKRKKKFH